MLSVCFREIISKTCHIQVKVPEDCIWQIVEKLLLPKTVSLTICLLVFYHLILHDFILVSSSLMAVSNLLLVFDVFRSQFGASLLLGLYPFHFSVLFQHTFSFFSGKRNCLKLLTTTICHPYFLSRFRWTSSARLTNRKMVENSGNLLPHHFFPAIENDIIMYNLCPHLHHIANIVDNLM